MTYMTVQQAAEAWGVTVRQVQIYCAQDRIPGARKFGMAWQIPANASKPADARRKTAVHAGHAGQPVGETLMTLMPLMNTAFKPGQCLATIDAIPPGVQHDIACAEYLYFSGQAEKAAQRAELYLTHPDRDARLSACLIYAYANLTLGQIQQARVALGELQTTLARTGNKSREQPQPLQLLQRQCSCTCLSRKKCRLQRNFCPFCPQVCGLLPCMCWPITCT